GKVPQVDSLAIMPDLSSPLVNPANPKDAYISAFVVRWNPHIPKVLRFGNKPKVFWSVVSLIAVNVVYVTIWPLFMRHQPNDSMGKIFITHKAPREIAGAVFNIESRLSSELFIEGLANPISRLYVRGLLKELESACFVTKLYALFKLFVSNIVLAHCFTILIFKRVSTVLQHMIHDSMVYNGGAR